MSQEIIQRLEAMASPNPDSNGFHSGMHHNRNAVELEFGQMLYGAVLERKPEAVVEIGTGPGYSGAWILLGLEKNAKGHLWTIDITQPNPAVWDQVECPTARLTYVNEMSRPIPKGIPKKIDILFHDGSHDWFNDIVNDFGLYLKRVPVGGVVLLHDVVFRSNMGEQARKYFEEREPAWDFQEVSMGCGMLISRRME